MLSFLVSSLACTALLAMLLFLQFGGTTKKRPLNDITGYFVVRDMVQTEQRVFCSIACLLPLTALYGLSLYHAEVLTDSILTYALANSGIDHGSIVLINLRNSTPPFLLPIIVLVFPILFLRSWFVSLQKQIEVGILYLLGARQQANEVAGNLATSVLRHISYGEACSLLEKERNHPVRLPSDLIGAPDIPRLSFQLLQLARFKIPAHGVHNAIHDLAEKYFSGIIPREECEQLRSQSESSDTVHFISNIFWIYIIVVGIYAAVVPLWGETLWNYDIEWPRYEKMQAHLVEIGIRTLTPVLPTIVAVLYVERRWEDVKNAKVMFLYTIVSFVSLYSLVINSSQIALYLVKVELVTGEYTVLRIPSAVEGLSPEVVYIVGYTLVAAATIPVLVLMRRQGRFDYRKAVVGSILFGVGFYCAQLAYELSAQWEHANYTWHQGLLGLVLGLAAMMPVAHRTRTRRMSQKDE